MAEHTPGPWKAFENCVKARRVRVGVCILEPDRVFWGTAFRLPDNEEMQANARLIAAVPDLLAAAMELRAAFRAGCGDATRGPKRNRLVKAGRALDEAIAKAKGGAP